MREAGCAQVLARVFITPMPMLRLLERLGVSRELKLLQEAVATMRGSLLGVIHVRARKALHGAMWCARKDPVRMRPTRYGGPGDPVRGCYELMQACK